MENSVLLLVYPPEEIFVTEYSFDDASLAIDVTCKVPQTRFYTAKPIPYVTAENYVRCLSQSCYLLAERVLERGLVPLDVDVGTFRKAAEDYELYYRNLAMTFHKRVARGEQFSMRFKLENWRELRGLQDFVLFTFANERTVISGEMSFVFVA